MIPTIAIVVLLLSSIAWVGQLISWLAPQSAVKWGLTESPTELDATFQGDVRAECFWDSLTLWTLPIAALLALMDHRSWPVWDLLGGGMYIYFTGRGIAQRVVLSRRAIKIGTRANVTTAHLFLSLFGLSGGTAGVWAALHILNGGIQ